MTTNAVFPQIFQRQTMQQQSILRDVLTLRQGVPSEALRSTAVGDHRNRLFASGAPFGEGLAAGEMLKGVNVWASASLDDSEDHFAATAYTSTTSSGSVGIDFQPLDRVTLGLLLSGSETDSQSTFNTGGSDSDGVSMGLYGSMQLTDIFSVDGNVGFSRQDIDNFRVTGGGARITGSQDSDSSFVAVGATAAKWWGNWGANGRVGLVYSEAENDSYVDSTGVTISGTETDLAQAQVSGQVNYYAENPIINSLLFLRIGYNNSFERDKVRTLTSPQPPNDNDEFVLSGGVNFFADGRLTGGVTMSRTLGRDSFSGWSVAGTLAYSF